MLGLIAKIEVERILCDGTRAEELLRKLFKKKYADKSISFYISVVRIACFFDAFFSASGEPYFKSEKCMWEIHQGATLNLASFYKKYLRVPDKLINRLTNTEPYDNPTFPALSYERLMEQAKILKSLKIIVSGKHAPAYEILKDLDLDLGIRDLSEFVGARKLLILARILRAVCLMCQMDYDEAESDLLVALEALKKIVKYPEGSEDILDIPASTFELENVKAHIQLLIDAYMLLCAIYNSRKNNDAIIEHTKVCMAVIIGYFNSKNDNRAPALTLLIRTLHIISVYFQSRFKISEIEDIGTIVGMFYFNRPVKPIIDPYLHKNIARIINFYEGIYVDAINAVALNNFEDQKLVYIYMKHYFYICAFISFDFTSVDSVHLEIDRWRFLLKRFLRGIELYRNKELPVRLMINTVSAMCSVDRDLVKDYEVKEALKAVEVYLLIYMRCTSEADEKNEMDVLEFELLKDGGEASTMRRYSEITQGDGSLKTAAGCDLSLRRSSSNECTSGWNGSGSKISPSAATGALGNTNRSYSGSFEMDSASLHLNKNENGTKSLDHVTTEIFGFNAYSEVVELLLSATKIILLNYTGRGSDIKRAVAYAEQAFDICNMQVNESLASNDKLMFCVYENLASAYAEFTLALTEIYERNKYRSKAHHALSMAEEINPNSWNIKYIQAFLHCQAGEKKEARNKVSECLKLNPEQPCAWNLLSLILASEFKYEAAIECCSLGFKRCLRGRNKNKDDLDYDSTIHSERYKEQMCNLIITQAALEFEYHVFENNHSKIVCEFFYKSFDEIFGTSKLKDSVGKSSDSSESGIRALGIEFVNKEDNFQIIRFHRVFIYLKMVFLEFFIALRTGDSAESSRLLSYSRKIVNELNRLFSDRKQKIEQTCICPVNEAAKLDQVKASPHTSSQSVMIFNHDMRSIELILRMIEVDVNLMTIISENYTLFFEGDLCCPPFLCAEEKSFATDCDAMQDMFNGSFVNSLGGLVGLIGHGECGDPYNAIQNFNNDSTSYSFNARSARVNSEEGELISEFTSECSEISSNQVYGSEDVSSSLNANSHYISMLQNKNRKKLEASDLRKIGDAISEIENIRTISEGYNIVTILVSILCEKIGKHRQVYNYLSMIVGKTEVSTSPVGINGLVYFFDDMFGRMKITLFKLFCKCLLVLDNRKLASAANEKAMEAFYSTSVRTYLSLMRVIH